MSRSKSARVHISARASREPSAGTFMAAASVCLLLAVTNTSDGAATAPLDGYTEVDSTNADRDYGPTGSIPAKVSRYAQHLIRQADFDDDDQLNRREWGRTWGFLMADSNRDGRVSLEELVQRIARYGERRRIRLMPPLAESGGALPPLLNPTTDADTPEPQNGRPVPDSSAAGLETTSEPERTPGPDARRETKFFVPEKSFLQGLPAWFSSLDADGDGQLTMAEFAPKATSTALAEFARYDANRDGLVTADEYLRAVKSTEEASTP